MQYERKGVCARVSGVLQTISRSISTANLSIIQRGVNTTRIVKTANVINVRLHTTTGQSIGVSFIDCPSVWRMRRGWTRVGRLHHRCVNRREFFVLYLPTDGAARPKRTKKEHHQMNNPSVLCVLHRAHTPFSDALLLLRFSIWKSIGMYRFIDGTKTMAHAQIRDPNRVKGDISSWQNTATSNLETPYTTL